MGKSSIEGNEEKWANWAYIIQPGKRAKQRSDKGNAHFPMSFRKNRTEEGEKVRHTDSSVQL